MIKKNTDGSFHISSLGIDVPDLETLRKLTNELRAFDSSPERKAEAMKEEKAERNFQKWRKTHLRKLKREILESVSALDKVDSKDPEAPALLKRHDKLVRERESLSATLSEMNHLKAFRDAKDRWRVKLIQLYGSKEDKAAL